MLSPKTLLIAAVCGLAACASQQGEALRPQLMARKATSLAEWKGGDAILREATKRMGIVLPNGDDAVGIPITIEVGGEVKERFEFVNDRSGGDRTKIGAAVPITKDGYFLTAKHNLGSGPPTVFLHDRSQQKLIKSVAVVVWQSGDDADLALLRTTHQIAEPFALADMADVSEGDRAGSTGWSGLGDGGVFDGMAAGRVRSLTRKQQRRPEVWSWWEVTHDAPIQPGDSGGPLIDERGRLIGIHSGGKVGAIAIYESKPEGAPLRGFRAISNLPDGEWLMEVIERDCGEASLRR